MSKDLEKVLALAQQISDNANLRIARVRELHKSDNAEDYLPEYAEGNERCIECGSRYPCDTIRALDGETDVR